MENGLENKLLKTYINSSPVQLKYKLNDMVPTYFGQMKNA